jgi:hypothetical protein
MPVIYCGMSHRRASLSAGERLVPRDGQFPSLLRRLSDFSGVDGGAARPSATAPRFLGAPRGRLASGRPGPLLQPTRPGRPRRGWLPIGQGAPGAAPRSTYEKIA